MFLKNYLIKDIIDLVIPHPIQLIPNMLLNKQSVCPFSIPIKLIIREIYPKIFYHWMPIVT